MYNYESIPDTNNGDGLDHSEYPNQKRRMMNNQPRRSVCGNNSANTKVCSFILLGLFAAGTMIVYDRCNESPLAFLDSDISHQDLLLPSLLSVYNLTSHSLLYIKNRTLYEQLHKATFVPLEKSFLVANRMNRNHTLPKLHIDKRWIQENARHPPSLTLSWADGDSQQVTTASSSTRKRPISTLVRDDSILALYCSNSDTNLQKLPPTAFLEAASIGQARLTSRHNQRQRTTDDDVGTIGEKGDTQQHSDNSWFIASFPILRKRLCHFRLFVAEEEEQQHQTARAAFFHSNSKKNLSIHIEGSLVPVAQSAPIHIHGAWDTPTAIHSSYGDRFSDMTVQFTTGFIPDSVPVLRFCSKKDRGTDDEYRSAQQELLRVGTSDTYTADHLCSAPGNLSSAGNFYPPGILHAVGLHDLQPDTTYCYQVALVQQQKRDESKSPQADKGFAESSFLHWSEEHQFTTAQKPGTAKKGGAKYIVYGDQGCPYLGWQVGQAWLDAMVIREANISCVHHIGDISYAQGAAHVWDEWFRMVQPIATKVALMVGIGNHEYDHTFGGENGKDPSGVETSHGFMPEWGNYADDSGGECGIPMSKRFRMPESSHSNDVFWYSYDDGLVHTIMVSSEHELSPGSRQYLFLEHDLRAVDRSVTPWVVVETHRPLYESEGGEHAWPNKQVGEEMRHEFESLLLEYRVDIVFAGHYHEYLRTCDGLYAGHCNMNGPVHITIGTAGGKLDDGLEYKNRWTARHILGTYGYGRVSVFNSSDLHFEFVQHGIANDPKGGVVKDDVWIHRHRKHQRRQL